MNIKNFLICSVATFTFAACHTDKPETVKQLPTPPIAKVEPFDITAKHGHVRTDNYYWLNDRENPAVLAYLNAENAYTDSVMADTKEFQESLYKELRGRIKEDDNSAPYFLDGYYYYTRYEEGGEYGIFARKKGSLDAPEEIVVNGNELGKDKSFFNFYTSVSPDHSKVAVIMDTVGRNFYQVMFKDLSTGEFLADQVPDIRGNVVWTLDNQSVYYPKPDKQTLRNDRIFRHKLGDLTGTDELVYTENDATLNCNMSRSKSKAYLFISADRTDASQVFYIDAAKPSAPKLIAPVMNDVEYSPDHIGGKEFLIYHNYKASNYRLSKVPIGSSTPDKWTNDMIPHRDSVYLAGVDYFKNFIAIEETENGLARIVIQPTKGESFQIAFDEPAYDASLGYNPGFDTDLVRYNYTSLTTPNTVYDYNMKTRVQTTVKVEEVKGDFDRNNYETERIMVKARDGKMVPMSIVYRKDSFKKDGSSPGWIYGYGSYGASMPAYFSSTRLSLLDRGFVYAIAHIRGGKEMGGSWHDDGKMMNKRNTFTDFIDCSKWLQDNNYVAKDKLFASGGSAGGLLMGAISNMSPETYRGIVADVAFVDVVTTMMDESIPLTTFEWLEWGNPNIQPEYEYMLTYSPYDNVEAKDYPAMLVTTGLHDSQVQYWEPAKWVSKLRALKTDSNPLLLKTNMVAGHGGASGRFESLREVALEYAFAMKMLGIEK